MAHTPVDDGLGRDSSRPSFRCPEWLLEHAEQFRTDYNRVIEDVAGEDDDVETLMLDSQSDALRRLVDIGLGAFYGGDVRMFAAPPGEDFCVECGADGPHIRVGIIPHDDDDQPYDVESRLCLSCLHEEFVADDEDDEVVDSPFDGVEA